MSNDFLWVEKYRPTCFGDIVLNSINKEVCSNIINQEYFPNLLFYGPPGTGKTTSVAKFGVELTTNAAVCNMMQALLKQGGREIWDNMFVLKTDSKTTVKCQLQLIF